LCRRVHTRSRCMGMAAARRRAAAPRARGRRTHARAHAASGSLRMEAASVPVQAVAHEAGTAVCTALVQRLLAELRQVRSPELLYQLYEYNYPGLYCATLASPSRLESEFSL